MPLSVGDKLGPYQILAPIGAGGMGEVYRAMDTKLDREVAIKVLPATLAQDPERLARFEREAKVLASLNHSNIAQIYGVEESSAGRALVMELVPGRTLQTPLPQAEALRIAVQIAEALEAAHDKGIIHRDLKPANIMIKPDGAVKVLDFGLAAVAQDPASASADSTNSPTLTMQATQSGMIMGTAAYMSPEQASGKPVDKRADIWSFGVVVWEMLTGRRLFHGESVSHTLADVLRAEIDFDSLPASTPPPIRELLKRCLDRGVKTRLRDIGEARIAIQNVGKEPEVVVSPAATIPPPARWYWIAAGGVVALVAVAAGVFLMRPAPKPAAERSEWQQLTSFTDTATDPAFSPDGRMMAFKRGGSWFSDHGQIYVKMLPNGRAVQLTHDNLSKMAPVFSPDGSRIVYSATGTGGWDTWEVPVLAGGEPRRMLANAEGLQWIDPQHILYSECRPCPSMGVVVSKESRAEIRDVYIPTNPLGMAHFSAPSPDRKQVLIVEMGAGWLPCRLAPFDGSSKGRQVGPVPGSCTSAVWSQDGRWMYFTADTGNGSHIWRQKSDGAAPEQITSGPTTEQGIAMAPDGRFIVSSVGAGRSSVWIHDVNGERQISSEGDALAPYFSSDGTRVFYVVQQPGRSEQALELWATDLNSGRAEPVLPGVSMTPSYTVSRDGKAVAYVASVGAGEGGLWYAQLDQSSSPRNIVMSGVLNVAGIGTSGDVFYTAQDFRGYRIAHDGTGSSQLVQGLARAPGGNTISPDERWEISANGGSAYPLSGGRPVALCAHCFFVWSPDGKSVAMTLRALMGAEGVTGVIPLRGNGMLPPMPPEGVQAVADLRKIPGSQVLHYENASPGPSGSFAYTKRDTLRNLYRIPLP